MLKKFGGANLLWTSIGIQVIEKKWGRGKGPRSTTGPCQENKDKYMIKIHLKIFIYKNNRPREYWFILYP